MDFKKEEAFGLTVIIIAMVFVLVLAGSGLHLLDRSMLDNKTDELARSASRMGLSMAIEAIQIKMGSETAGDPLWATFFQDTDIDDDGIIAKDGETDVNRDGVFDVSTYQIYDKRPSSQGGGRNGIDDDGDGIIDDLPGISGIPEIAPTGEDTNGNRVQDMPDGVLEDAFGIIMTDGYGSIINEDIGNDGRPSYPYNVLSGHPLFGLSEDGYDPVNKPDPQGDDYHPIFYPAGTEGNGRFDVREPFNDLNGDGIRQRSEPYTDINGNGRFDGETDLNENGKLDTVENSLQKWLRYSKRVSIGTSMSEAGSKDYYGHIHVRVSDANSKINLNGPDLLTAMLLNHLLKVVELVPKAFNMAVTPVDESISEYDNSSTLYLDERGDGRDSDDDSIIDDGTFLGLNSRGIEYDCELDTRIVVNSPSMNQKNNVGTTTARADDADAVLIIKYRNSLPGKRFSSIEQLLDVSRPGASAPSACTSPALTRKAGRIFDRENINRDPGQTEEQAIFVDNRDEFERLKDFITVEGWEDTSTVKLDPSDPTRLMIEPRFPVNLNTATKEVLHAVTAAGIEVIDTATYGAAWKLATHMIMDRLKSPFTSWSEFEKYMDDIIGTETAKSFSPVDIVLLEEKSRLITQFEPNTRLQKFNPDTARIRPLDKTHIGTPTTELSLSHSGYYEIDAVGITTGAVTVGGIDDKLLSLLYPGEAGTITPTGELGRKKIAAVVKVMDILRHTTQKDFEDYGTSSVYGSFKTKSLSRVSSHPENMSDTEIGMGSTTGISLDFNPTALAVDEITGNVYAGGDSKIGVWRYNEAVLQKIGTATITGAATFLSIDPSFTSTDFGRLYVGVSGTNDMNVFDIMGTVTPNTVRLQKRKNIRGDPVVIPKRIALDVGHKVIVAAGSSSPKLLEWRYPPGDVHAIPEVDDLYTPSIDESRDLVDNDGDGLSDDTGTSTRGSPETLIDYSDSDGDGVADDSLRPKTTQPKHPAALSETPYTIDTEFSSPPVDIAFDSGLEQFFVTGTNTVASYRDSIFSHTLVRGTLATLSSSFLAKAMAIDSDSGSLYILGNDSGDKLIRLSTAGTPTAFYELDTLPLGSVMSDTLYMVMDEEDDVIFVLNEGPVGTVTAIDAKNERLRIMPVSGMGMGNINDARAIGVDSRRNRVYIAEGSSQRLKIFEYRVGTLTTKKQAWTDGQIQLISNAVPLGTTTQILYYSNFRSDFNLMGTDTPVLVGTGTPLLIVNGAIQMAYRNEGLFVQDTGTVTARLAPDGVILQTVSTPGTVSGSIISYDPGSLFGIGTITADMDGRGIRYGAVEFWIKFPRLTNPWAVPEAGTQATDNKDNDGDGFIDDAGGHPAAIPEGEAKIRNGIDDDSEFYPYKDGYVDDVVGIGVNADTKPREIVLFRLFHEVPVRNEIFVTKNNGVPREEQLGMILGTSTTIVSFVFDDPVGTYTVFSKLFLRDFGDTNNDGLIDSARLELERFSFPGTITVAGIYTPNVPFNKSIYPGAATFNAAGTTTSFLSPGKWKNIVCAWWLETDGLTNKEDIKQNLMIDGVPINGASTDLGTDTSFLLGTMSARLSDLISGTSTPIFHMGAKIFDVGTVSAFMATVDDLVIYNGTSSVVGEPKRFASAFGTNTFKGARGDPYQDYNLNFQRDDYGHKFKDDNNNGVYDVGEAFDMGSSTVGFTPPYYDSSGEFCLWYGERFFDAGTTTPYEYGYGERYRDYNRNGVWDKGEFYINTLPGTGTYDHPNPRPGDPGFIDFNNDCRQDDSGYFIRNFGKIIPAGSKLGTLSWTEYLPEGTDVSFELTAKALDGKILWRWFSGNGTGTGTRIDLPVAEDAILEYRTNFFAVGTQTESPIIDDVTVTVIRKKPEIISIIER